MYLLVSPSQSAAGGFIDQGSGESQGAIAEALGVSRETVNKWYRRQTQTVRPVVCNRKEEVLGRDVRVRKRPCLDVCLSEEWNVQLK